MLLGSSPHICKGLEGPLWGSSRPGPGIRSGTSCEKADLHLGRLSALLASLLCSTGSRGEGESEGEGEGEGGGEEEEGIYFG